MDVVENNPLSAHDHDDDDGPDPANHLSDATTQKRHPPFDHEALHPYLETMSQIVYDVVTTEVKNIIASTQAVRMCDDKQVQELLPRWTWWNDRVSNEETNIPKWCSFKVSQSTKDVQGRCNCSPNALCGLVVIASTPACAAVHGLSGGTIGKCQLIRLVVESLKSLQRTCSEEVEVPRVLEVSVLEKSAHVNVTLEVPPSMLVCTAATGTKPSSHSTKPASTSMSTNDLNNISIVDPISEFMSRQDSITNQLSNTTSPSCPAEELDNSHQRRFLNVRSVPVHESTLQPEVHQLYCRYQSAIHGDVDPFMSIAPTDENIIHLDFSMWILSTAIWTRAVEQTSSSVIWPSIASLGILLWRRIVLGMTLRIHSIPIMTSHMAPTINNIDYPPPKMVLMVH